MLLGCSNRKADLVTIQSAYLDEQISDNLSQVKKTVEETGMTEMGIRFLLHSEQLLKRFDTLENLLSDRELDIIDSKVKAYLNFAELSPDSVELETDQLIESLQYINTNNTLEFTNNLKLFTIHALSQYRNKFLSYFYNYDWVRPVVVPNRTNYKKGDAYKADIFLEASNSGILPIVKIDLLDDQNGYFEIPVGRNSRAHLEIGELKRGITRINIRVIQLNNGKERRLDKILEIEAE